MTFWLLIDGYNVIGPVAPPARGRGVQGLAATGPDHGWLGAERRLLLDRLADRLPPTLPAATCVVFDAKNPPPSRSREFRYREIDVQFAIDHDEADDLLEELIAKHPVPKQLTVVSSDHRIVTAARRRRAVVYSSASWLDALLDGRAPVKKVPAVDKIRRNKDSLPNRSASPSTPVAESPSPLDDLPDDDLLRSLMGQFGPDLDRH